MSIVNVEFKRTESSGVSLSAARVAGEFLDFNTNGLASLDLEEGKKYLVRWYILGSPNSKLSLEYSFNGKTKIAFKDSKIPSNRSRKTDFTVIEIK